MQGGAESGARAEDPEGVPGNDLGKVDGGLPGKQGGPNEHFDLPLFLNRLQNGNRGLQRPYTHEGQGNIRAFDRRYHKNPEGGTTDETRGKRQARERQQGGGEGKPTFRQSPGKRERKAWSF